MIQVDAATDDDIARFYSGARIRDEWFGFAAKKGKLVVAIGGVIKTHSGPWHGFMDVPRHIITPVAFRYAMRLLKDATAAGAESVLVACDETIPRSMEFLLRLGFVESGVGDDGRKVFEWRD